MTKTFSLEETVKKLEAIEGYFQRPDMKLDEAIEKHKDALALAQEIFEYLDKAESTIAKIDIQGKVSASPEA